MRAWIGEQTPTWPDGATLWQVYVVPAMNPEFMELLEAYEPIVRQSRFADCLSPTTRENLHITVQPLAGWHADYTDEQINELLAALRLRLADVEPFETIMGPALCGRAGVLLDMDQTGPGQPWDVLYTRITEAVRETCGAEALAASGWPPHMGIAYGTATRDSGEIQSPLRRVRPGRAPLWIDAVQLCEVMQDSMHQTYTWTTAHRVPLRNRES